MPTTINAGNVIGRGLIAKVPVTQYNGSFKKIGLFKVNDPIGVVYSYIQRGDKLFWMIWNGESWQQPFYVEHGTGRFVVTDEIKEAIKQQEIKTKGEVPYYIEKYGPWLLLTIVAVAAVKTYVSKNG